MTAAVSVLTVGAFALVFALLRVPGWAAESLAVADRARRALADPNLDDRGREVAARAAAGRLLYVFGVIVLRTGLALVAAVLPVVAADRLGIVPAARVAALLSRPDVVLGVLAVLVLPWFVARWRRA